MEENGWKKGGGTQRKSCTTLHLCVCVRFSSQQFFEKKNIS